MAAGRRFALHRDHDVSGISGEGVVAEGVCFDEPMRIVFPDGSGCDLPEGFCVIRWGGARRSTVLWESFDDAVAVHGHGGATRFVWADGHEALPTTDTRAIRA